MNTSKSNPRSEMCPECEKCLQVLQVVLDGEAKAEDEQFVADHIQNCEKCLDCYETDKTLRETIKGKVVRMAVPQDLVNGITLKINAVVG